MSILYLDCCSFFFGLAIGSFLNVIIYRVPRNLSIVHPPSACPICERRIRPWENIPIFSYCILLRGRCAGCGNRIPIRYPLVELTTGIVFTMVAHRFGYSFETLVFLAFSAVLIALSVIDLQTKLLPDVIILPALLASCVLSSATLFPAFQPFWSIKPMTAFLGMASGGIPLLILAWVYMRITGREGMGGGDIKLMFLVGALLGPKGVILTLFIGSLTGSVVGVLYLRLCRQARHTQIPFGPFLSLGAWIAMMWGNTIVSFYLKTSGLA
ncbi:prepilin peptidase [bacterium]|nr:prepilin peptidase [candidate division CSSED10-310 bacterium]